MFRWFTKLFGIYFASVYVFTFFNEFRPSEPFLFNFLIEKWENVTSDRIVQEIYPVGTFSKTAVVLILVTGLCDVCLYKWLLFVFSLFGICVSAFLLWIESDVFSLNLLNIFYGTFAACEVAYFTYIYAKVDKEYYQQVTSHTRAAILAGRAISGIMGQLLISFEVMDYKGLNYITFGAMIGATIWSLLLPPVNKSIYFHQEIRSDAIHHSTFIHKAKTAFRLMWNHFAHAFSNKYTVKWSVWWALATCGFVQVQVYMQPLWAAIVNDPKKPIYNGAVEAVLTILGFLGALFAGVLKIDWKTRGELALTCCSLLQGFLMLISSQTKYVFVSYACYIAFGGLYHLTITVASSEIAKNIEEDSYGLVFGINTFLALVFQTVLTLVVVTQDVGFALPPKEQYFVYGIFHIVLAFLYIIIGLCSWLASKRDYRRASTIVSPPVPTVITR